MVCAYCHLSDTDVKNSRPHKKTPHVWRRRLCTHCHRTFTTDEHPRYNTVLAIRYGAELHPFNQGILITSISDAFRHDSEKGRRVAWDLSQTVIDSLLALDLPEIPIDVLRTLCHDVIYRYDRAAGTQYAIAHQLPF